MTNEVQFARSGHVDRNGIMPVSSNLNDCPTEPVTGDLPRHTWPQAPSEKIDLQRGVGITISPYLAHVLVHEVGYQEQGHPFVPTKQHQIDWTNFM